MRSPSESTYWSWAELDFSIFCAMHFTSHSICLSDVMSHHFTTENEYFLYNWTSTSTLESGIFFYDNKEKNHKCQFPQYQFPEFVKAFNFVAIALKTSWNFKDKNHIASYDVRFRRITSCRAWKEKNIWNHHEILPSEPSYKHIFFISRDLIRLERENEPSSVSTRHRKNI